MTGEGKNIFFEVAIGIEIGSNRLKIYAHAYVFIVYMGIFDFNMI